MYFLFNLSVFLLNNLNQQVFNACQTKFKLKLSIMKTMNKLLLVLAVAIFSFSATALGQARVQVIHNSADMAAQTVDVWLDDELLIENFKFRTATSFINAPADVEFTISIQPPNSTSPSNPLWSQNYTLADGETYVLIANGIVSPSGYDPLTPFDIYVYPMAREVAISGTSTDVLVFHGSTDAPLVDVVEVAAGAGTIVDDIAYGEFDGYLELPTADYSLQIRNSAGTDVVAQYAAPLSTLALDGEALSVIASGFLDPSMNSNGPSFGLWVALASGGDLIELPSEAISTARVQVIHNSADPAAASVDVWLDNVKLIPDFDFRTATPFIDAPANVEFTISIQPPGSTSPNSPIWSQNYTLAGGEKYILVAGGNVAAASFPPEQPFDIFVYPMAQEIAGDAMNTDVLVFHGSTDAPVVDVVEVSQGPTTLSDDLAFGAFDGYLNLPTADYSLQIRDETGSTVVAQYGAPLSTLTLDGQAISVVASGFLDPAYWGTGNIFGLYVALASGGPLVELPAEAISPARVQVIHNSADLAAETVDVWLDNVKLIPNFEFRTATPFINAPQGVEFTISIQPPNSTSPDNPLWSQNYTLTGGEKYILVANGIVSPTGYEPAQPFDIYVYPLARETASDMMNTDVLVFHGSTDAPVVDVVEVAAGAGTVIDDLAYGSFDGYLELPTADYSLQIRNQAGTDVVAQYAAPLSALGLDGEALSVVASGFLDPAMNSNGPAFGLWVALAAGGDLIELPAEAISTARVQVVHNSADLAAETVDVWLDDVKLIPNFEFRTATPFIDAPAVVEFTISIQPPNSTSPDNPLWSQNYTLTGGEKYILVANGIVSPTGYEPAQPFDIYVYPLARETASDIMNTDVLVFHGSTDAPVVDVVEVAAGAGTVIDDLAYGSFDGYLELPTADYSLQIRNQAGTDVVAQYAAPLSALGLDGEALSVVASGFLDPAMNSNGPAFGLWVALAAGGDLIELPAEAISTARVQVIHNSADEAAEFVDVWLNDMLLIDDFEFRTATPFIDAPAGEKFTISIQPPTSTSSSNPLWSQDYTLAPNGKYILIANGIVSATGYTPLQPFDIYVFDQARETGTDIDKTDILVFHGGTDAPTVDIWETKIVNGPILDDLSYGDFASYLELPTLNYDLQLRDETSTQIISEYVTPLYALGMQGEAGTIVASGFLNPESNSNGEEFGLWLAFAEGGDLFELAPEEPSEARVQVIHNSADTNARVVDIWLNNSLLIDDFEFRTATPFIDAPAGEAFTISVKGPNSSNPLNPIWSKEYTLEGGETYILVANGIVSPEGYEPNEPFDIYVYPQARQIGMDMMNTDVLVFHGSTDAPIVDVVEVGQGAGAIIDDLAYGEYTSYMELPTADYSLQVRNEAGTDVVAQYAAPLSTLGLDGNAITVIASGFLNPASNSNGEAFGLWVATMMGGELLELPAEDISTARVQVIHNSADLAAAEVDVWLNDVLLIDNFAFRTASPFIDAPAGEEFTIAIQPPTSTSPEDPLWSQNYTLEGGEKYQLVANGIVSPTGYDPSQPFDIYVYPMAREGAMNNAMTDVLVFHGSTDAPTVDIWETAFVGGPIIEDLMYGEYADYLELETNDYTLEVRDETGTVVVAAYLAPLATLGLEGQAISVVASGFLNPANNSNGPAFGLWVSLAGGGELIPLSITVSVEEGSTINESAINVYPNPARSIVNVNYTLEKDENVSFELYNMLGNKMQESSYGYQSAGSYSQQLYISDLVNGMYLLRIQAGDTQVIRKVKVQN